MRRPAVREQWIVQNALNLHRTKLVTCTNADQSITSHFEVYEARITATHVEGLSYEVPLPKIDRLDTLHVVQVVADMWPSIDFYTSGKAFVIFNRGGVLLLCIHHWSSGLYF